MRHLIAILPGVLVLSLALGAQTSAQHLAELRSDDPGRRLGAFYRLAARGGPAAGVSVQAAVAPLARQSPPLRAALIEALGRENAYLRQGLELGDEYSNYYGDLLAVVAQLGDARAIPALADAMGTGHLAMSALAQFGRPALDAVLERLNQGRSRRSACAVLGRMLDPDNPAYIREPESRKRIEDSLLDASRRFGPLVKVTALEALTRSDRAELRQAAVRELEELAGREGGTAQDAAFHSLRWLAEGGGPATARTLAVDALGAIARRPDGSFRQPAATALQQIAKAEDGEAAKAAREALGRLWRTNRLERLLERAAPPEQ